MQRRRFAWRSVRRKPDRWRQGRPAGSGKLAAYREIVIGWVEADGDLTLYELTERLAAEHGVAVHHTSLSRLLKAAGFTVKKTLLASETDRADIVRARRVWRAHHQPWMKRRPERLVFIDETGTTTKMTRLRGRARRGQRLRMKAPFGHWGTQTFIAALRHDGLTAPWECLAGQHTASDQIIAAPLLAAPRHQPTTRGGG